MQLLMGDVCQECGRRMWGVLLYSYHLYPSEPSSLGEMESKSLLETAILANS